MSVIVGSVAVEGNVVRCVPPTLFNSVYALRLSNYTAFPVQISNVGGSSQSQQLLMPNQQMVYPTANVSSPVYMTPGPTSTDTLADIAGNVFAEYSTDPAYWQTDFAGVYPAQLSLPADVVAEAIFTRGVPNVFLEDLLVNGTLIAPNTTTHLNTVGKYGSILMTITNAVAGQRVVVSVIWYSDTARTHAVSADNFTLGTGPTQTEQSMWEMPVRGIVADIILRPQSQGNITLVVTGNNRTVTNIRQVITTVLPRTFQLVSTNVVNGTAYQLLASDGLGDYSSLNGECELFVTQVNAIQASIFYTFTGYSNAPQNGFVSSQALAIAAPITIEHPGVPVVWHYLPGANSNAQSVFLTITPGLGQS